MSLVNPLAAAVAAQPAAQGSLEAEKVRQARRAQNVSKNVAAAGDRFEHIEVESADAIQPIDPNGRQPHPEPKKRRPTRRPPQVADEGTEPPHLDVKA